MGKIRAGVYQACMVPSMHGWAVGLPGEGVAAAAMGGDNAVHERVGGAHAGGRRPRRVGGGHAGGGGQGGWAAAMRGGGGHAGDRGGGPTAPGKTASIKIEIKPKPRIYSKKCRYPASSRFRKAYMGGSRVSHG